MRLNFEEVLKEKLEGIQLEMKFSKETTELQEKKL
jgi:hypothetical protein